MNGQSSQAARRRHPQAARRGRDAHARAVRRAAQPRRRADDRRPSWSRRCRRPTCWCRPSPTASTPRVIAQAGEQLKLIANFGTGVDNIDVTAAPAARHHRHQHARRPDRRHRRHDHGADPGRAAPAGRGRAGHAGDGEFNGWSPTWMLGRRIWRQAARHRRHGPHRPGGGAPRPRLRPADPLPQPQAASRQQIEAGAGGDLLGKPRPDAGPHGHRLGQLPAHAGDLPSAVGAAAEADAAARLSSSTPRAAR